MAISYDRLNNSTINYFGIDATYTPQGGGASTLRGIFDYTYFLTEGEIGIQARQALFIIEAIDAPSIATGDALLINGKNFTIRQVRPDGTGVIELDLEEIN